MDLDLDDMTDDRIDASISLAIELSELCEGHDNSQVAFALTILMAGVIVDTGGAEADRKRIRVVIRSLVDAIRRIRNERTLLVQ